MGVPLRVLIAEDNESDADLLLRELRRGGYDTESRRIDSAEAMRQALEEHPWDLVLCDYSMPQFDAPAALVLLREFDPDTPFIVVSGSVPETTAVSMMDGGAHDYIFKDNLTRFVPVVRRELQEAEERRQRRRAEEALRQSERQYRRVVEAMTEGLTHIDADNLVSFANARLAEMLGRTMDEVIGRSPLGFVDEGSLAVARQALEQGRGGTGQQLDALLRRKDGAGLWAMVSARSAFDDEGRYAGATAVITDITERKRAEEERARLLQAIEQSGEIIVLTDARGRIEYSSPAFGDTIGRSAAELVGREVREAIGAEGEVAEQLTDIEERVTQGETWHGRLSLTRHDGSPCHIGMTVAPVYGPSDHPVAFITTGRDVTDVVELESQVRRAQKLDSLGQLAGGVAHDFNNLLVVILGYGEVLLRDLGPSDPRRESAEAILEAGRRAAELTRQLLAFSRRQVIQPRPVNLGSLIAETEKMLRRLISENVQITIGTEPDLWETKVDVGHVEQVVMNLAVNARDAMPRGGTLCIETANAYLDAEYVARHADIAPGAYVMLVVSDTGCGMDAQTQDRIFEPFFSTKGERGTGLGLATVYGIVRQNKGHIWVYSEVGQGSTFKLYFPRYVGGDEGSLDVEVSSAVARDTGATILLAEDDKRIRELLSSTLERVGHTVLVAADGEEAVRVAREFAGPIHLMLTDVIMPRLNGSGAAAQLAELRPEMRVIYMTGYTDNSVAHHGILESGASVLSKPFSESELLRAVRAALADRAVSDAGPADASPESHG